ncbi:CAMK/CAMKL/AMPK protein kinase [Thecamonas trahens ATCC 50062]|uniref:CAMK/CAMKL/AMPK protein kinase n=1 Tax=Thecamonas trahens ATCC 50062 TaxID=461836 RepID=A0A0L0DUQ7_THETB|nr:CAMK/CAMKL/AMPK protein kinase [Thecamonas trahens ATCC 50062]KNC55791.1 CAMK/CAMKL/AMPK protein kinase [Thecamonas trahens ATCC 50062]|eukprot:XP_013752873.1 CAMK/CAMKL/AMPK protein kinase [Thecamonas trahens ATCC 50062]
MLDPNNVTNPEMSRTMPTGPKASDRLSASDASNDDVQRLHRTKSMPKSAIQADRLKPSTPRSLSPAYVPLRSRRDRSCSSSKVASVESVESSLYSTQPRSPSPLAGSFAGLYNSSGAETPESTSPVTPTTPVLSHSTSESNSLSPCPPKNRRRLPRPNREDPPEGLTAGDISLGTSGGARGLIPLVDSSSSPRGKAKAKDSSKAKGKYGKAKGKAKAKAKAKSKSHSRVAAINSDEQPSSGSQKSRRVSESSLALVSARARARAKVTLAKARVKAKAKLKANKGASSRNSSGGSDTPWTAHLRAQLRSEIKADVKARAKAHTKEQTKAFVNELVRVSAKAKATAKAKAKAKARAKAETKARAVLATMLTEAGVHDPAGLASNFSLSSLSSLSSASDSESDFDSSDESGDLLSSASASASATVSADSDRLRRAHSAAVQPSTPDSARKSKPKEAKRRNLQLGAHGDDINALDEFLFDRGLLSELAVVGLDSMPENMRDEIISQHLQGISFARKNLDKVEIAFHRTVAARNGAFFSLHVDSVETHLESDVLDTYRLMSEAAGGPLLGRGTTGKVFLAKHIATDKVVAIKKIRKANIESESEARMLAREIAVLQLVQHPNIVELYEVLYTARNIYIVMEHCGGGSLKDAIDATQSGLKPLRAAQLFGELLSAMIYLHSHCLAHRDIKPDNILLSADGHVKLADFGFATIFDPALALTTFCGTPCFAAPELMRSEPYDPRAADMWSAGVTLFRMLSRELPFHHSDLSTLYDLVRAGKFSYPRRIKSKARKLISSLLDMSPTKRATVKSAFNSDFMRKVSKPVPPAASAVHRKVWTYDTPGSPTDSTVTRAPPILSTANLSSICPLQCYYSQLGFLCPCAPLLAAADESFMASDPFLLRLLELGFQSTSLQANLLSDALTPERAAYFWSISDELPPLLRNNYTTIKLARIKAASTGEEPTVRITAEPDNGEPAKPAAAKSASSTTGGHDRTSDSRSRSRSRGRSFTVSGGDDEDDDGLWELGSWLVGNVSSYNIFGSHLYSSSHFAVQVSAGGSGGGGPSDQGFADTAESTRSTSPPQSDADRRNRSASDLHSPLQSISTCVPFPSPGEASATHGSPRAAAISPGVNSPSTRKRSSASLVRRQIGPSASPTRSNTPRGTSPAGTPRRSSIIGRPRPRRRSFMVQPLDSPSLAQSTSFFNTASRLPAIAADIDRAHPMPSSEWDDDDDDDNRKDGLIEYLDITPNAVLSLPPGQWYRYWYHKKPSGRYCMARIRHMAVGAKARAPGEVAELDMTIANFVSTAGEPLSPRRSEPEAASLRR